jgi:hypothetical protein
VHAFSLSRAAYPATQDTYGGAWELATKRIGFLQWTRIGSVATVYFRFRVDLSFETSAGTFELGGKHGELSLVQGEPGVYRLGQRRWESPEKCALEVIRRLGEGVFTQLRA